MSIIYHKQNHCKRPTAIISVILQDLSSNIYQVPVIFPLPDKREKQHVRVKFPQNCPDTQVQRNQKTSTKLSRHTCTAKPEVFHKIVQTHVYSGIGKLPQNCIDTKRSRRTSTKLFRHTRTGEPEDFHKIVQRHMYSGARRLPQNCPDTHV